MSVDDKRYVVSPISFKQIATDKTAWALFGISLGLRLVYLLFISEEASLDHLISVPPDTRRYIQLAIDFSNSTITNESNIYMTGFGYSLFLSVLLLISNMSFGFALFAQLVLSALCSMALYWIGFELTGKRAIGILAGVINATSLTAMTLGASFLSETLFFFLLLVIILLFYKIIKSPTYTKAIALGLLLAYLVFTRSVAQFFPFVLILVALISPTFEFATLRKAKSVVICAIGVSIAIILISGWGIRNYNKHGTFVVAGTGPGAACVYLGVRVAANRSDSLGILDYREVFGKEILAWKGRTLTYAEANEWYTQKVISLFEEDPASFISTFFEIVKENVFAPDQITVLRRPSKRYELSYIELFPVRHKLDVTMFWLSIAGFGILLARRKALTALLLGAVYLYFAGISGFTYFQGSRILYPAQASWAILQGTAIYFICMFLAKVYREYLRSPIKRLAKKLESVVLTASSRPKEILGVSSKIYKLIVATLGLVILVTVYFIYISPMLTPAAYIAVENVAGKEFGDGIKIESIKMKEKNGHTEALVFNLIPQKQIVSDYRIFLHAYPLSEGDMLNLDFSPSRRTTDWQVDSMITEQRSVEADSGVYGAMLGLFNSDGRLGESILFRFTVKDE